MNTAGDDDHGDNLITVFRVIWDFNHHQKVFQLPLLHNKSFQNFSDIKQ